MLANLNDSWLMESTFLNKICSRTGQYESQTDIHEHKLHQNNSRDRFQLFSSFFSRKLFKKIVWRVFQRKCFCIWDIDFRLSLSDIHANVSKWNCLEKDGQEEWALYDKCENPQLFAPFFVNQSFENEELKWTSALHILSDMFGLSSAFQSILFSRPITWKMSKLCAHGLILYISKAEGCQP